MFWILLAPRSILPIRVKAFFRRIVWRSHDMVPNFYGDGVPGWVASYSWRNYCIAFLDDSEHFHFVW